MNHKDKDKVQNVTRCDSDVLFSFISKRKSQTETNLFFWMSWKQVEGKNKLAIEFGLGRKTGVKSLPTSLRERSRSWMRNNFDDYVTLSGSVWDSLAVLALIFARLDRLAAQGLCGCWEAAGVRGLQVVALPSQSSAPAPQPPAKAPTYLQ